MTGGFSTAAENILTYDHSVEVVEVKNIKIPCIKFNYPLFIFGPPPPPPSEA
jgi:hypothetical protein